ncbi:MAG: methylase, partial [Verrucomicrobiaceae bacterium]|nr:methylase [Verrucomicrobiaceae bacterium]
AELAVEEAFRGQEDITKLTIFDGACGSGILLTTAYRKMMYEKERITNRRLGLSARIDLLKAAVFGGDVNEMACRVTAFSLYLCLLERLVPADIVELQGNAECKLPKLVDKSIAAGRVNGDFFSEENPFATSKKFDVVISNPPWRELKADEHSSALVWAEPRKVRMPHRQIAAAFAVKATEAAKFGGRVILILPTSLITAPTNADFLRQFTVRATIERIINLADFRRILFANAEHACTIVHAKNIPGLKEGQIEGTFEYWAPKADISFALNRLTLHEYDMMRIRRASLVEDNDVLRRRFWGGERDEHLILRLRQLSSLRKFLADRPCWIAAKGYHKTDGKKSANASDVSTLASFQYLDTSALNSSAIVVNTSGLRPFPIEEGVANTGDLRLYEGPRVLWSDGTEKDLEIRAAYTEERFAFSSSAGCLAAPTDDRDLARFLVCYLRSSLAQYWLVITGYSAASERARVTVGEIKSLPFMPPEQHPDPQAAVAAVKQASELIVAAQGSGGDLLGKVGSAISRGTIDKIVFSYFGISEADQMLIMDLVRLSSRSLQPTSYDKLLTPIQDRTSASEQKCYLRELEKALCAWSEGRGGEGSVSASLVDAGGDRSPLDVVHIELSSSLRKAHRPSPHTAVRQELLSALSERLADGRPIDFFSMPNSIFVWGDDLYITKPQRARFWSVSAALRDADEVFRMLSRLALPADWGKS